MNFFVFVKCKKIINTSALLNITITSRPVVFILRICQFKSAAAAPEDESIFQQ